MASFKSREITAEKLLPSLLAPYTPDLPAALGLRSSTAKLASLTVTRANRVVGRYLLDFNVLLLDQEEDRSVASALLARSGFAPRVPLGAPVQPGEPLLRLVYRTRAHGSPVLFLETNSEYGGAPRVFAGYDPSSRGMVMVADAFEPHLRRLLALSGLDVDFATTHRDRRIPAAVRSQLSWNDGEWSSNLDDMTAWLSHGTQRAVVRRSVSGTGRELLAPAVVEALGQMLDYPQLSFGVSGHVTVPTQPQLDEVAQSVPFFDLPDGAGAILSRASAMSQTYAPLLTALRLRELEPEWWAYVPATPADVVSWTSHALPEVAYISGTRGEGLLDEATRWFRHERAKFASAVSAIARLAPTADWTSHSSPQGRCLLCGSEYSPTHVGIRRVWVSLSDAICADCSMLTHHGPSNDPVWREGAVAAVQQLSATAGRVPTFEMLPSLVWEGDVPPALFAMLRPLLIGRGMISWSERLAAAGLVPNGQRGVRGQLSIAQDGHLCRSLFERAVDDFFSSRGIAHEPEPTYPFDLDLNPHGMRGDWLLAGATIVEAAGLLSDPAYAARMSRKRELCSKFGMDLLVIQPEDLRRLDVLFRRFTA